jgi:hypothetical protein
VFYLHLPLTLFFYFYFLISISASYFSSLLLLSALVTAGRRIWGINGTGEGAPFK